MLLKLLQAHRQVPVDLPAGQIQIARITQMRERSVITTDESDESDERSLRPNGIPFILFICGFICGSSESFRTLSDENNP